MRDLANFKGCPAPKPVTLRGRFVTVEPYRRAEHLEALWDGLGGMGINPLLLYFAQDDFSGIEDFAKLAGIRLHQVRLAHPYLP